MNNLEQKPWWNYLEEDVRELIAESFLLLDIFQNRSQEGQDINKFHDYSFVVFPAAKAYEGFLKKLFFNLNFIFRDDYYGSRFRIGKALNPSLEEKYRSESVYDKLVDYTSDVKVADLLWVTWKDSRNMLFHWFPDEKRAITLEEAKIKLDEIIIAVEAAIKGCKINLTN
ncbi:MAG: hypothetical protein AAB546_02115 [Patescibacteria group bacterium]